MIGLETGEWGKFEWMVNLAVGLLEMNEKQFESQWPPCR